MWRVVAERSRSPDPSSGVVSSRGWVWIPAITLVPLSKALYHNCFLSRSWKVSHRTWRELSWICPKLQKSLDCNWTLRTQSLFTFQFPFFGTRMQAHRDNLYHYGRATKKGGIATDLFIWLSLLTVLKRNWLSPAVPNSYCQIGLSLSNLAPDLLSMDNIARQKPV